MLKNKGSKPREDIPLLQKTKSNPCRGPLNQILSCAFLSSLLLPVSLTD